MIYPSRDLYKRCKKGEARMQLTVMRAVPGQKEFYVRGQIEKQTI